MKGSFPTKRDLGSLEKGPVLTLGPESDEGTQDCQVVLKTQEGLLLASRSKLIKYVKVCESIMMLKNNWAALEDAGGPSH